MKKYLFLIVVFCSGFVSKGLCQSISSRVIAADGGLKTIGNTSIVYCIGQPTIASGTLGNTTLTGGFVQPEILSATVDVLEIDGKAIEITLFPNPTTAWLQVKLNHEFPNETKFVISDINGRIQNTTASQINTNEYTFSTETLPQGLYFLQVLNGKGDMIKAFRFVKK